MIAGWLVIASASLCLVVFSLWIVFRRSSVDSIPEIFPSCSLSNIMPDEVKSRLADTEQRVYEKAEQVLRVAEEESGELSSTQTSQAPAHDSMHDPMNETAILKAISEKVARVQRLSEG